MNGNIARLAALAALAATEVLVPRAHAQWAGLVSRVSTDSSGNEGDASSHVSAISADGRFVAFESSSSNLVPGDNNDDSDVFVRDAQTGVVQRVSVAWNGMEGRDDSSCPAISADGRYVAFLSLAWNLYPGGANLGSPRADVYVHDRQLGTTTRVSLSLQGGDPNGHSDCPSISADGRRVVFGSAASNLVARDDNREGDIFLYDLDKQKTKLISKAATDRSGDGGSFRPNISGDGRFVAFVSQARNLDGASLPPLSPFQLEQRVFVRDTANGTTEVIDVAPGYPVEQPNSSSHFAVISADGRFVAFVSEATNLGPVLPLTPWPLANVYVRDRTAGRTLLASRQDPLLEDCKFPGWGDRCEYGGSWFPAISGDGRYVTFTSYSQRLLPMSFSHAPQAYVFDVLGERLRRVTVDPTGWEAQCTGESVISANGLVVAQSTDGGMLPQANARRDVYRQEWTCVADGKCRPQPACPPEPTTCATATGATLRLRKHPPGGIDEDRLFWRWSGAADATPLPDPTGDARYQLCVYAGTAPVVAMDVGTPEAEQCPAAGAPCWRIQGGAQKLHDPEGGLAALTVNNGESKMRILTRGKGPMLDAPFLPLTGTSGVTVQLQDATSGRCWGAHFPAAAIKKNFAGEPGYRSRRDGWLVAELG